VSSNPRETFPAGRTALVTGANRGIGLAIAEALLERGLDHLYAAARDPQATGEVLAGHADRVTALPLDLTDADTIARIPGQVDRLDILVNNAGVYASGGVLDPAADGRLAELLSVNLVGMLRLTRALLPTLRGSEAASIVNIASMSGLVNIPGAGAYSLSKAAVHSATQAMRSELRPEGILVMGVYPGPTATDMTAGSGLPMADPAQTARRVVEGLADRFEDVYPDKLSARVGAVFDAGPKRLEQEFAGLLSDEAG
jgi:NAD(P)-dependent dehydrogenase (short-subunit alcohol dehydrogenase family)